MDSNYSILSDNAQLERDALDRALDAVLAKYSAVEPGTGLEQRVLARLQSEQARTATYSWWQWSGVGAVAALLLIVATLAWRSNKPATSLVQRHSSVPVETVKPSSAQIVANSQANTLRPLVLRQTRKTTRRRVHETVLVADEPKLDQFPSPRPLSEQEKLALEYVEKSPQEAALVAQAQEAALIAQTKNDLAREQELENRNVGSDSQ